MVLQHDRHALSNAFFNRFLLNRVKATELEKLSKEASLAARKTSRLGPPEGLGLLQPN
jgi:hypothetical protein